MKRGTLHTTLPLSLVSGDPVIYCQHLGEGEIPGEPVATRPVACLVALVENPPPSILLCDPCSRKLTDILFGAPAERDGEVRLSRSASARTRRRGVR